MGQSKYCSRLYSHNARRVDKDGFLSVTRLVAQRVFLCTEYDGNIYGSFDDQGHGLRDDKSNALVVWV